MSSPPVKYARQADFTTYSTVHPDDQQPGVDLDNEFNTLATSVNKTIDRLAEIQRSDGMLGNQTVHVDALGTSTKALLLSTGVPRGAWVTLTAYIAKDLVTIAGLTYIAVTAHTAGTFATDLAAGKWMLFAATAANQSLNTTDSPTFAGLTLTAALSVAGVSSFQNGTAALPAITFTSDPDTGVYRVSANNLGLAAGGANVGTFGASGLILGQTIFSRGEQAAGASGSTNYQLQAVAAYAKSLIIIAWNSGDGFALVHTNSGGTVTVISSSDGAGGNNHFDTTNDVSSNGGNGISFFQNGGFIFIQTKTGYTGGAINVHKMGG